MNDHWGPAAWKFLHAATFSYSDNPTMEEKNGAEQFFKSLQYMLPCKQCKDNFISEINESPPDVKSKDALSQWLVNIHNKVNVRLQKPIMTYDKAKNEYDKFQQCTSCSTVNFHGRPQTSLSLEYYILIIVAIAIIFTVLLRR